VAGDQGHMPHMPVLGDECRGGGEEDA